MLFWRPAPLPMSAPARIVANTLDAPPTHHGRSALTKRTSLQGSGVIAWRWTSEAPAEIQEYSQQPEHQSIAIQKEGWPPEPPGDFPGRCTEENCRVMQKNHNHSSQFLEPGWL